MRTTVIGILGALGKTKAHSLNLPRLLKFSAIGILCDGQSPGSKRLKNFGRTSLLHCEIV